METATVQLTDGNIRNGHIYIRELFRRGWLSPDVIGGSNRQGGIGKLVRIEVEGLPGTVESDVACQPHAPGEPRGVFRERAWVGPFIAKHKLLAGDMIVFERLGPYHLRVRVAKAARSD